MSKIVYVNDDNYDLLSSLSKDTRIRAYKYVEKNRSSVMYPKKHIRYNDGRTLSVRNYNSDPNDRCAPGLNVATLNWCVEDHEVWRRVGDAPQRLIVVEFKPEDIICVPNNSFGKFRVKKLTVLYARTWPRKNRE